MTTRSFALAALALTLAAGAATAQEFVPPDQAQTRSPGAAGSGIRFGVLGFSTRGGGQVNKDGQGILGSTVDVMQLGSPQVRLRPSFEAGFGRSRKSLHIALEVLYRFQPDGAPAIPYLGAGVGYYDNGTTDFVWPTLAMGFELPFTRTINWLIEYHALDRLGRSRFFVGLATRSGGN
jgi:hypothetical protein